MCFAEHLLLLLAGLFCTSVTQRAVGCSNLHAAACAASQVSIADVVAGETLERDNFKSAEEARDFGLIDEVMEKRPVEAPIGT